MNFHLFKLIFFGFLSIGFMVSARAQSSPNIILIFVDDMGINDIGAYGFPADNPYPESGPSPIDNSNAEGQSRAPLPVPNAAVGLTPEIDSLASEGMKFTSFYASSPVCTPSRAGLMTGSYATRVQLEGVILHNWNVWGLNSREVTLPERLKQSGYATGMFGKWHLGDSIDFRPTRHGFDVFFGLATSHDLWPWHPNSTFAATIPDLPVYDGENEMDGSYTTVSGGLVSSPLNKSSKEASYENSSYLLEALTEKAIDFIDTAHAAGEPFFVYFSSHAPHTPCIPHPDFAGKSNTSAYYDVMMELDFRVGQILAKLDELGIAEDTIVLFTSDNGPFVTRPEPTWEENAVGSAYPYRGYKRNGYEGGLRVPLLLRYPARISGGIVQDGLASNIDLMPTLLGIVGGEIPTDRVIDGVDLWPMINGSISTSPRDKFFYYEQNDTRAVGVRQGDWKYLFSSLFNLSADIQEQNNVASQNSEMVGALSSAISEHNNTMSRRSRGLPNTNQIEIRLNALHPSGSNNIKIEEGQTGTFEVRLAKPANATVNIEKFSGDAIVSVSMGSSLIFSNDNYDNWQTVTVRVEPDANNLNDGATLRASSGSLHIREIFVLELDSGTDGSPDPVDPSLLSPPDNLKAETVSKSEIKLTWNDNSSNETGFNVLRATQETGPWTSLGILEENITVLNDTELEEGTTYFYKVVAESDNGESYPTTVKEAKTWSHAESWRNLYFNQIDNNGIAADESDFDKDGLPNLLERAFGSNPLVTDKNSEFAVPPFVSIFSEGNENYLAITYRRLSGGSGDSGVNYVAHGIAYLVEYDNNLSQTWDRGSVSLVGDPVENDDGTETLMVRLRTPISSAFDQYIRLSVSVAIL